MMEVFVCLCGTRVSQVSRDQIAAPVHRRPGPRLVAGEHATAGSARRCARPAASTQASAQRTAGARSKADQDGQIDGDIQWSRLLKPASMTSPLGSWPLGRSESALCRLELGGASWSSEPEPEP